MSACRLALGVVVVVALCAVLACRRSAFAAGNYPIGCRGACDATHEMRRGPGGLCVCAPRAGVPKFEINCVETRECPPGYHRQQRGVVREFETCWCVRDE